MAGIRFIVGLGNPGSQYRGTRHNIGFEVIDELLVSLGGGWRSSSGAEIAEARLGDASLVFVKPMTFMNRSGQPLSPIVNFHKGSLESIVVIHDEIDIPAGSVRIKTGGGEGGHNGLKSISTELGGKEYHRVRIGVGRPPRAEWEVSDWVLSRFSKDEGPLIQTAVLRGCEAVRSIVIDGPKQAQNIFNRDDSTSRAKAGGGEKEKKDE